MNFSLVGRGDLYTCSLKVDGEGDDPKFQGSTYSTNKSRGGR
jgi:hypothetical protein